VRSRSISIPCSHSQRTAGNKLHRRHSLAAEDKGRDHGEEFLRWIGWAPFLALFCLEALDVQDTKPRCFVVRETLKRVNYTRKLRSSPCTGGPLWVVIAVDGAHWTSVRGAGSRACQESGRDSADRLPSSFELPDMMGHFANPASATPGNSTGKYTEMGAWPASSPGTVRVNSQRHLTIP